MGNVTSESVEMNVRRAQEEIFDSVWNFDTDITSEKMEQVLAKHNVTWSDNRASVHDGIVNKRREESKKLDFYNEKNCTQLCEFQSKVVGRLASAAWCVIEKKPIL